MLFENTTDKNDRFLFAAIKMSFAVVLVSALANSRVIYRHSCENPRFRLLPPFSRLSS